jgi:hypothetical protein
MILPLFYDPLVVLGRGWLCFMLPVAWSSRGAVTPPPATPTTPRRQRATEPKPFVGLRHTPPCALCEHKAAPPQAPVPPDPRSPPHRRPRTVDTSRHVCLSPCRLSRSRRPRARPSARPWASQGWPLATTPLYRLQRRFPRASWHDLSWPAGGRGTDRPRAGVLG